VRNRAATVRQIARILRHDRPATASPAACIDIDEIRINFDRRDDEAWRSEVGEATRSKPWDACTPDIRDLLRLSAYRGTW
jgi:hypothetical protein